MSRRTRIGLKALVTAGLLLFLAYRMDLEEFWGVLTSADPSLVLLSCLVFVSTVFLSAARWGVILENFGMQAGFLKLAQISLIGCFFNIFLPSALGGDVFRGYYLSKENNRGMSTTLTTILLERSGGMAALLVIGLVATGLHWVEVQNFPLFYLFLLVAVGYVLANVALFHPWMHRRMKRLLQWLHRENVERKIELVAQGLGRLRTNRSALIWVMAYSFAVQLLVIVSMWVAARAIDLQAPFWVFLTFIPVVNLAIMIPLTINGIGLRESAYYLLFSEIGVPVEVSVTLSLLNFFVVLAAALPGGVAYSFYKKGVGEQLSEFEHELHEAN